VRSASPVPSLAALPMKTLEKLIIGHPHMLYLADRANRLG
jgi:hypothetical protein